MATSKEQHDARDAAQKPGATGFEQGVGHTPRGTERERSAPPPQGTDPARAAGAGAPSQRPEQQADGQPENQIELDEPTPPRRNAQNASREQGSE